jgi:hypothetical protein
MAFLRETVGSLRAYFILVAALGALVNVVTLLFAPPGLVTVISLVGLGFALAHFYIGVRLKQRLGTSPTMITGVLIGGAALLVLVFFYYYALTGAPTWTPGLGLLITWYLYRNVRRLAAEMQRTPQP